MPARRGFRVIRVSDHFQLGRQQAELDFVDVPLNTDLPLFVDPYALSLETEDWLLECRQIIVDYFTLLLERLRSDDVTNAKEQLAHLSEANDVRLGLSRGRPQGRGIGLQQAARLYMSLAGSRAVETGNLQHLEECQLMVEGIGRDKISDMTVNLIRGHLLDYTTAQCETYGIPLRRRSSGLYWDAETQSWGQRYADLPELPRRFGRLLLVPKAIVRRDTAFKHDRFFDRIMLDYFEAEHLDAGSSLVVTLRNGRRRVPRNVLRREHPCSKSDVYGFIEDHPEELDTYSRQLVEEIVPLTDEEIEARHGDDDRGVDLQALRHQLEGIPTGREHGHDYHELILGILEALFYPELYAPKKEYGIHDGRKRIDVCFANRGTKGFFRRLKAMYDIPCANIVFECKNYQNEVGNPEFDQLVGRLSPHRGMFGVLVCREVRDRDSALHRCRDILNQRHGFLIWLEDEDITHLLDLKDQGMNERIDEFLRGRLEEVLG